MRHEEIYNDGGVSYGIPIAERPDPASMPAYSEQLARDLKNVLLHAPAIAASGQIQINKDTIAAIHDHMVNNGPYTYMIRYYSGGGNIFHKDRPVFIHITGLKRGPSPLDPSGTGADVPLGFHPDVQVSSYGGSGGTFYMRYYVFAVIEDGFSLAIWPTRDFTVGSGGRSYYVAVTVTNSAIRGGHSVVGSGHSPTPRGDVRVPEDVTPAGEITATLGADGTFDATVT